MLGRLVSRLALLNAAAWTIIAVGVFGLVALSSLSSPLGQGASEAASVITVRIGDNWFCDPAGPPACSQPHDTVVDVGDTVVWEWGAGGSGTDVPHTTTNCDGDFLDVMPFTCSGALGTEWQSLAVTTGTFSHPFGAEDAGKTFLYLCEIHPATMRGRIIVQAAASATPTPTPAPTPTPTPTATATPTPTAPASPTATPATTAVAEVTSSPAPLTASLPAGGGPPPEPSGSTTVWVAIIGGAAVALGLAALVVRRAKDESRGQRRS